jgi:hypothetical protein
MHEDSSHVCGSCGQWQPPKRCFLSGWLKGCTVAAATAGAIAEAEAQCSVLGLLKFLQLLSKPHLSIHS